jgi:hypothetical protein
MFHAAIRNLFRRARPTTRRRSSAPFRPRLEGLEDRQVMSTTTVTPADMGPWAAPL